MRFTFTIVTMTMQKDLRSAVKSRSGFPSVKYQTVTPSCETPPSPPGRTEIFRLVEASAITITSKRVFVHRLAIPDDDSCPAVLVLAPAMQRKVHRQLVLSFEVSLDCWKPATTPHLGQEIASILGGHLCQSTPDLSIELMRADYCVSVL
jgi:hypothetical protein